MSNTPTTDPVQTDFNIFPDLKDWDFQGQCHPPTRKLPIQVTKARGGRVAPTAPDRLGFRLVLTSPSCDGFRGWVALPSQVDASQRCLRKNAPRPVTVCSTAGSIHSTTRPSLKAGAFGGFR